MLSVDRVQELIGRPVKVDSSDSVSVYYHTPDGTEYRVFNEPEVTLGHTEYIFEGRRGDQGYTFYVGV